MNRYADLDKPFKIVCDASNYQLGSCILQDGYPIAYWSKTLSPAQRNYTTTEKELLAIVLTLKEYRTMLLGGDLHIFTDHKNLIFRTLSLERVLRWRLYMEQFYYKLDYLEGDKNILADCFSRLPRMDNKITVGKKEIDMNEKQKGTLVDFKLLKVPSNESRDDELNVIELKTTATSKDWSYDKSITTNNRDEPEIFPTMCTNDNHKKIYLYNKAVYK